MNGAKENIFVQMIVCIREKKIVQQYAKSAAQ
jgi:hypothetical protein